MTYVAICDQARIVMGILVIEEGAPNGMDFVVGDHLVNPLSRAKEAGQQILKVVDLGDEYALANIQLQPAFDETKEHLCVLLVAVAGRNSPLVGLQAVPVVIGEVGRVKVADLKAGIAAALSPPEAA